jgi:hypothetical protein
MLWYKTANAFLMMEEPRDVSRAKIIKHKVIKGAGHSNHLSFNEIAAHYR